MGFNIKLKRKPRRRINTGKITKKIHERLRMFWRTAAKDFLAAIIADPSPGRIGWHVDTGMSLGSLIPLATDLKMKTKVMNAIIHNPRGKIRTRDYWKDLQGNLNKGKRDIARGIAEAQRLHNYHLSYGTPSRPVLHFDYSIAVFQYAEWESAWDTIADGSAAFRLTIKEAFSEFLPNQDIINWLLEE